MAIEALPNVFKKLTFDGQTSASFGVQILGEGVFNAPERAVELVNVPGRNGALAIDQGYYENIEVTYPANIIADSVDDFQQAISDFRNFLCSRQGYCKLEDDYNPNEYRMAIYKSGLEVTPTVLRAGEFEITFECKPQRWLISGENAVSLTSGDSIINPTLLEANPLIEAEGYGTITIGDYEIEIDNAVMGEVTVANSETSNGNTSLYVALASELFNNGDTLTVQASKPYIIFYPKSSGISFDYVTNVSGGTVIVSSSSVRMYIDLPEWTVTAGATDSDSNTCSCTLGFTNNGTTTTGGLSVTVTRSYLGSSIVYAFSTETYPGTYVRISSRVHRSGNVIADSTVSILGTPTYLDCDLGVCYKIENDKIIDLNAYIDLGSDLPVLSTGATAVTYDNTITSLDIVPRWWQL